MFKEMAEHLQPPRVVHVRFPFGRPLGEPNCADQQRVIIEDALHVLETAEKPGTIIPLAYRWKREDYAEIRRQRASQPS
ncbi:MAG: hypothetical protein D6814_02950 [Calditrichaeota bacterium]|nr:MAG: hypothetical protein D6814_02950 [Calditrichota bacterium]